MRASLLSLPSLLTGWLTLSPVNMTNEVQNRSVRLSRFDSRVLRSVHALLLFLIDKQISVTRVTMHFKPEIN